MYTVTCWSIQSLVKSTSSRTHFYCKQKLVSWQPLFLRSNFTLLGHALFQKLTLVSTFWCLFRVYATKTTNFRFWGSKFSRFVFGGRTRASSLPKIKARFHIFMLVSWLCDQNDQLWFLGSKFTRCNSTHIAISAMTWFEKVGGCSTQSTPDCGSPDSE